ncbi:MAG: hypothetical protein QXL16_02645, partial [Candidatus Micrarchaeaceae archaeon]
GRILILDFKTGKSAKSPENKYIEQVALYRILYSKKYGIDIGKIDTAIAYIFPENDKNAPNVVYSLYRPNDMQMAYAEKELREDIIEIYSFHKKPELFIQELRNNNHKYNMSFNSASGIPLDLARG